MLQLVALFGIVCALIGAFRLFKASNAPEPNKAKRDAITLIVFAVLLIGIGTLGAPIAIKLAGL